MGVYEELFQPTVACQNPFLNPRVPLHKETERMSSTTTPRAKNPLQSILEDTLRQVGPQIAQALVGALVGLLGGILNKKKAPAPEEIGEPSAPAPAVTTPGGSLPQVPVPTRPSKTPTAVALVLSSMEKPERVGGGPGVNYSDARGMVQRGENFNFGCVGIFYGQLRDQNGDEYMGEDIVAADLEFRTAYRVYRRGTDELVAFMIGEGDTSAGGEGQPKPWHQSGSGAVNFGVSRWLNSAGFDNRLTFVAEGQYDVELEIAGIKSARVPINVS